MIIRTNNPRFRMFTLDNQEYLLDSDISVIFFIFPFLPNLIWLFPFKAYKINKNERAFDRKIVNQQSVNRWKRFMQIFTPIVTVFFMKALPEEFFSGEPLKNHEFLLTFFVFLSLCLISYYRLVFSKKHNYNNDEQEIQLYVKVYFIKYFKENFRFFLRIIFSLIIPLLLFVLLKSFVLGGNPVSFLLSIIIYTALIFSNQTVLPPTRYDIKIIENQKETV